MNKNIILIAFLFLLSMTSCTINYMDYQSHIEPNKGNYNYGLYLDAVGIGDLGFYVLKIEKDINPKDVYVEWNPKTGSNKEQDQWIMERTILFNYAEAGFHTSNPKIEIVNNKFLVMSRGGYYHGLYDIEKHEMIYDDGSPWNTWHATLDDSLKHGKYDKQRDKVLFGKWMKDNVHAKIDSVIGVNQ